MTLQLLVVLLLTVSSWFAINWIYQVVRKPSELFFPVSGTLYKTPSETWTSYEPIFRKHSTATISPELLAALAQVEGSGNPIVRTYWRWSLTHNPFEVYRPASSAVGMYQITDGTFDETSRLCIHDHEVVRRRALARLQVVLVQQPLHARDSVTRGGNDVRLSGSSDRRHPRQDIASGRRR